MLRRRLPRPPPAAGRDGIHRVGDRRRRRRDRIRAASLRAGPDRPAARYPDRVPVVDAAHQQRRRFVADRQRRRAAVRTAPPRLVLAGDGPETRCARSRSRAPISTRRQSVPRPPPQRDDRAARRKAERRRRPRDDRPRPADGPGPDDDFLHYRIKQTTSPACRRRSSPRRRVARCGDRCGKR